MMPPRVWPLGQNPAGAIKRKLTISPVI